MDALKATVPGEVGRCMELFHGIKIEDRECLLAALRRCATPTRPELRAQFKSSNVCGGHRTRPVPLRAPLHLQLALRHYVAHRRRQRGSRDTYGELSAKTRQLIEENTAFVELAERAVYKIDKDYITSSRTAAPADKAAALEASSRGNSRRTIRASPTAARREAPAHQAA